MGPIRYLNSLSNRGIEPGLERIKRLMKILGHPERQFKAIHVTGTNGKGSVCAMLDSILRKCGYVTGLYSSPHLVRVNERIRVSGEEISDSNLRYWIQCIRAHGSELENKITYFEMLTAVAFATFAQRKVDCAIVEVGLGGRWDATNVHPHPEVSIITNVSLEHTHYLGNTVKKIAREKAGILKSQVPCVTAARGAAFRVIANEAKTQGASLFRANQNNLSKSLRDICALKGSFQDENIKVVLKTVEVLRKMGWKCPPNRVRLGFKEARWPGRFQWLKLKINHYSISILLDGAHNPNAMEQLLSSISKLGLNKKKCLLIFNVLKDKDVLRMVKNLLTHLNLSHIFIPALKSERGSVPQELKKRFLDLKKDLNVFTFNNVNKVKKTIDEIRGIPRFDWILATGSLVLIGELFASKLCLRNNYEKRQ